MRSSIAVVALFGFAIQAAVLPRDNDGKHEPAVQYKTVEKPVYKTEYKDVYKTVEKPITKHESKLAPHICLNSSQQASVVSCLQNVGPGCLAFLLAYSTFCTSAERQTVGGFASIFVTTC